MYYTQHLGIIEGKWSLAEVAEFTTNARACHQRTIIDQQWV